MAQTNSRMIFVNLSVRNLEKSKEFWSKLGFEFNPKFTDEKAACMVLSEQGFVMLLGEPFFKTFSKREICDTRTNTEAILALSCLSRDEVDAIAKKAADAGGSQAMDPQDLGFMYSRSFYDLDGHHWEVMWMDPAAAQ